MWKAYAGSAVRNNRAAAAAIVVAVFIAATLISTITAIFYNLWTDNIRRIVLEEGDWQGRLISAFTEEDARRAEETPGVAQAVLEEAGPGRQAMLIRFENPRAVYSELPLLAESFGLSSADETRVQYHTELLIQYYIYSPEQQKQPPLLLSFYVCVMLVVCFSLVLMIYNAFDVSMNARIHQLGILQSVGATPGQIRTALLEEALALSLVPLLAGIAAGVGLNILFVRAANAISTGMGTVPTEFDYSLWVFLAGFAVCLITVGVSAWVPARRLSRMTPLEAIRGGDSLPVKKVRSFRLLSKLFGIEGELARKSLYTRRKAFRTATVSLTLSFLVFGVFLNFMTLSDISTQLTYFERYKDRWDLLAAVEDTQGREDALLGEIRALPEAVGCTAYRKATAYTQLTEDMLSPELRALGSLEALKDTGITAQNGSYQIKVPIVVLDDASFEEYCAQAGITAPAGAPPSAVTVNQIWDSAHSHFRERAYLPYINPREGQSLKLYDSSGNAAASLDIAAYTDKTPELREEYDDFALLQIMAESAWQQLAPELEADTVYFNIKAVSEDQITPAEAAVTRVLDTAGVDFTMENRQAEAAYNVAARKALNIFMGILCGFLALIGIANVFSNILGHIGQRKREFVRYQSIGMTPESVNKVLLMEALIIGLRPILLSLPLNVLFVIFSVTASKLKLTMFIGRMPLLPLLAAAAAVLAAVGLAYLIGGRIICRANIADTLRDDTLF